MRLGFISEKYESGGVGPGVVSSGEGDPGRKSYGVYQLSRITLLAYLRQATFKFKFSPFSLEFDAEWKETADDYPSEFALDQHLFITKYLHIHNAVFAHSLGYDTKDRRIQEAIFSIAVQHGGAAKILTRAYLGKVTMLEQIQELYGTRWEYVQDLNLPENIKKALQKRYINELADVLAIGEGAFLREVKKEDLSLRELPSTEKILLLRLDF